MHRARRRGSIARMGCSPHLRPGVRSIAIATAVALLGCSEPQSILGLEGRAELSYVAGGHGCLVDCRPDRPIAAGAQVLVEVLNATALPELTATSSDPGVMRVERVIDPAVLRLTTFAAGEVELQLVGPDGALVDRFRLEVHDVATIDVERLDEVGSVEVTGEWLEVPVALRDARGAPLYGVGALTYEASPHVEIDAFDIGDEVEELIRVETSSWGPHHEAVSIRGDLSGASATVTASAASGASRVIPIDVIAPDITSITISGTPISGSISAHADIAIANEGPGIWACCTWTLDPMEVIEVTDERCEDIAFSAVDPSRSNEVTITCESHGVSGSLSVVLD